MAIAEIVSQLMPKGKPAFDLIRNRTSITKLCETGAGRKNMRMYIFLLVKSFCDSLNAVRNMNEDQMIEAAAFLLDECGDMRLEDYLVMFAMAKRDQLGVRILDRLDIQIIAQVLESYWVKRNHFANRVQESWYSDQDIKPSEQKSNEVSPEVFSAKMREFREQLMKRWEDENAERDKVSQMEIERRQKMIERRREEWEKKTI